MTDSFAAKDRARPDSHPDHLGNEKYVFEHSWNHVWDGFKGGAGEARRDLIGTAEKLAVSAALGYALGATSGAKGFVGLLSRGAAAAASTAFLFDAAKPAFDAATSAWNAPDRTALDRQSEILGKQVGRFAFDTLLQTPGTMAGTYAGSRLAGSWSGRSASAAEQTTRTFITHTMVKVTSTGLEASELDFAAFRAEGIPSVRALTDQPDSRTALTKLAMSLPTSDLPKFGARVGIAAADADSLTAVAVLGSRNSGRGLYGVHELDFEAPRPDLQTARGAALRRLAIEEVAQQPGFRLSAKLTMISDILDTADPDRLKPLVAALQRSKSSVTQSAPLEGHLKTKARMASYAADGHESNPFFKPHIPGPAVERILPPYKFVVTTVAKPVRFDFGIEITKPELLQEQPNLDHHGPDVPYGTPSAAEQALHWPEPWLPKPGATLATVKPDADSLTAMAVLTSRIQRRAIDMRLVEAIGRRDRGLRSGPNGESYDDILPIVRGLNVLAADSKAPLFERIAKIQNVLESKTERDHVFKIGEQLASGDQRNTELALKNSTIIPAVPEKLAVVKTDPTWFRTMRSHARELSPVSLIEVRSNGKFQYQVLAREDDQAGKFMARALHNLNDLEAGWRGRPSYFMSPVRSTLPEDMVLDILTSHIDPPMLTRILWNTQDYLKSTFVQLGRAEPYLAP